MEDAKLKNLIVRLMAGDKGKENRNNLATTMVKSEVLLQLADAVDIVLDLNIKGDFIECGTWRGGCCILMKHLLNDRGDVNRKVWVADSFQGLPKPNVKKYPKDRGSKHWAQKYLTAPIDEVKENFKKFDCLDARIVFLPGWFKDTMKLVPDNQSFSILRLDGDIYESTIQCMNALFPKLSMGGFLIVDDFRKPRVKDAINDYYKKRKMKYKPNYVGFQCAWWRK